ncbi:MAG: adenosylcobinamide-GDP ribazoletransferase [Actinomycetota bacterium]|nr:adenosylcobinamide-GDP ribazoletransferase [Actinomycetota bacterium]
MKKSDIGTFGVMAVVLALAFKISLIYYLYQNYSENIFSFLVILSFFSCFGRWSMVYLLTSYKPVKKEGSLAAMFQSASNRMRFLVSTIYTVILFFILVYVAEAGYGRQELFLNPGLALVPGLKAMVAFLASLLALIVASHLFYRRLGGINGDVAGAVSQVTEITFLLFSLILVA